MILRISSGASRLALVLVTGLLAGSLAYYSLRNARAEYLSGSPLLAGLERATRLEPGNARHWYLLGRYWQYNLEHPDPLQAIRCYQNAISFEPQSPGTWLDLAEAYESIEDLNRTREALLQARAYSPVSADTAWRYGNFLLRQGEQKEAFAEIKRSLTLESARAEEAVSLCWRANPDVRLLLDEVLPPSREVYLVALKSLTARGETGAALAVWQRLSGLHSRIHMKDVTPFVDLLLVNRRVDDAEKVWRSSLSDAGITPPEDPAGSVLWDGGMERDVAGGFGWQIQPVHSVQIGFDSLVKHSGQRSLRVRFDGTQNIHFEHVCKYVPVTPNTDYAFSAWMRTEAVTTDSGLVFHLASPESPKLPAVTSGALLGTNDWKQLSLAWRAGKETHLLLVCLERRSSEKLDNQIAGTVWVDDAALVPTQPGLPVTKAAPGGIAGKAAQKVIP